MRKKWEGKAIEGVEEVKSKLREEILDAFDYSEKVSDEQLAGEIDRLILREAKVNFLTLKKKEELRNELYNSIRGLDILEELLEKESVTEIMVNGPDHIFVEENGRLSEWDKHFESEKRLNEVIQRIAADSNRIVNEANPLLDARLEGGSRINIALSPVALNGPAVTIRKFSKDVMTMERLIELGAITTEAADFLKLLVRARYNIFISGGTGSGKTTFLNVLSGFISPEERLVTIEDSAELRIEGVKNIVRLEMRNKNVDGCNEITIRDLVRNALRMRPDRLILGEVRGDEAVDMLSAMNTGHDGSLSTGHANSVMDMMDRLETMILLGTDIPLAAARKQISSAIDFCIHLARMRDGSRKVIEISEILACNDGEIEKNPLFVFKEKGEDEKGAVLGNLVRTGNCFIQRNKMKNAGLVWEEGNANKNVKDIS
ncbi:MAG: CpaF family protein [Lachnospiraceae bacterium]|nr:CpaF family protein [Lachnospiraceae bacterium]